MPMPSMAEIGGMIAATTVATCSVLRCTAAAQSAGSDGSTGAIEAAADALRAELGALSLREVRRRAEQGGVSADRLDEALETTSPKRATIELILQHRQREEEGRAGDDAALRAELGQLKLRTRPTRGRRSCACCCSARPRRSSPRRPPTSPRRRRLRRCGRSCRR